MNKYIACIIVVIAFFVFGASYCSAQAEGSSAVWKDSESLNEGYDYRVATLESFLKKYDSPLTSYAPELVYYADQNGLDYRLVPAITGVESTFGKRIPQDSYNAYGWANGNYNFDSWESSIATVSSTLKANYLDKGAVTVNQIARIYAPPSTTWAVKVQFFMNKIDAIPVGYDL